MPLITNIITATLTAYCSCKEICTKGTGITANGNKPKQQHTIAASRAIPFGSQVHIQGLQKQRDLYSVFIVEDRLARRYDSRFDIYFESHEKARQFGIKTNQTIKIITTK